MAAQDLDSPFDYIIAGGGTAGLVLAARLSEDEDIRVLVVEAGGDRGNDPLILTPGLVTGVYGKDEYDWNFLSTPQVSRSHGNSQVIAMLTCDILCSQHLITDKSTKLAGNVSADHQRSTS